MSLAGLKIAVVGPLPPPAGGMANQMLQHVELLSAEGVDVSLVQVNRPYKPALISQVKGLRALFRLCPYFLTLWRNIGKVDLVHVMANSGWSWHLFAAPAVWVAKLRGKPVVLNYRGGEAGHFFSRSWRWVKPTLDRADSIIVPSGFLKEVFANCGVVTNIVPNILDLSKFTTTGQAGQLGDTPHIVVTRNLEPIYDVSTVIRAFASIKSEFSGARLSVAGSGPDREGLESLVAQLDLEDAVIFCGRLTNEEIIDLYQSADLMLNSSLADNSPNSLIEALAAGVPVASSNVGGIPYLIKDRVTGLLVEPSQPEALAQAGLELFRNSDLRDSVKRAGKNLVQRFEKSKVMRSLEVEYGRVLGARA